MPPHDTHDDHIHDHGPGCGHASLEHDGHTDYLHDGHLHRNHADHVDECALPESDEHPATCTPEHECGEHAGDHDHGPRCGHPGIPHADHVDYVVNGHLHHPHGEHCDDHGRVDLHQ